MKKNTMKRVLLAGVGTTALIFSLTGCSGQLKALAQNESVKQEVLEKLGEVDALQDVMPELESLAEALPQTPQEESAAQPGDNAPSAPGESLGEAPAAPGGSFSEAPAAPGGSFGAAPAAPGGSFGEAPAAPGGSFGEAPAAPGGSFGEAPAAPGGSFGEAPQLPGSMNEQQPADMNDQMAGGINGQMPGGMNSQMPGQMPADSGFNMNGQPPADMGSQLPGGMNDQQPGNINGQFPGNAGTAAQSTAASPTAIVESSVVNTAKELSVDEAAAETIVMSESNNQVKIEASGTYIINGSCSDGNIVVKKGTTGVVLILKDLDLTSTSGATVSCNKGSEVKLVIEGTVKLTDAEDPADETSADTTVADAFDGAALKVKDGANVYLTGSGSLIIDASACKNGIKIGDADTPSFVIDGSLTININAANDGINGGYDVTILSGTLNINAGDDAIHADRILTIGRADGSGPVITVTSSKEGLEGTVVNLFGGRGSIKASDDAVNAANSDGTFASELTYSINITGGSWDISCSGDGLDSNGNINITGGSTTIRSGSGGGEAGLDYIGSLYVADGALTNYSGVAFDAGMGQMPGQMSGQPGQTGSQPGQMGSQPGQMPGGMGSQRP